jgi:hypothetical protein
MVIKMNFKEWLEEQEQDLQEFDWEKAKKWGRGAALSAAMLGAGYGLGSGESPETQPDAVSQDAGFVSSNANKFMNPQKSVEDLARDTYTSHFLKTSNPIERYQYRIDKLKRLQGTSKLDIDTQKKIGIYQRIIDQLKSGKGGQAMPPHNWAPKGSMPINQRAITPFGNELLGTNP